MFKVTTFLIQALLVVVFLTGCDKADKTASEPKSVEEQIETVARTAEQQQTTVQGWAAHIVSAPNEWVSASRPLKVTFSHSVVGEHAVNTPLEGVVSVEPQLAAKAFFNNDRELTIEFPEPLQREVKYTFTLSPEKLDGIEKTLQPYQFSVQAFKQDFSLQIDGLQIDPLSEAHTVTGAVETNDAANPAEVEKMLLAVQDGAARTIEWRHVSDTEHRFTVQGITRNEQASSVRLEWDGAAIGVGKKGSQAVQIPSLSSFDVVSAVSRQGADQLIEVNFSEALDRSQSLRGLIEIDGDSPKNTRIDGNRIQIYPNRKLSGEVTVAILPGIRSTKDAKTLERYEKKLTFLSENPGVRFVGTSYIIPRQTGMMVPIEAVNVDSVQITAYRTPMKNIGQFIQSANLTARYSDSQTNVMQWRKTYALPDVPKDKWQKYDLDLNTLVQDFGSDMFALEIRIDRSNIILDCGSRPQHDDEIQDTGWATQTQEEEPAWVEQYYRSVGYASWSERSNPCSEAYYQYNHSGVTQSFRYFSSSNLGLIAKMAVDHRVTMAVTDINSAQPLKNVKVTAYNYQHQPVASGETDGDGFVSFVPVSAPYYLIAEQKGNISFLRLLRNEALSTNVFDVGGDKTSSGVKGFFYGERDVWRPGDDIFLTFIVQDKAGNFPDGYPLTVDFFDPKGTKKDSITNANPLNGFYHFKLKTQEQSPTGNWRAVIRYGNQYFDKRIPVEAIVPNRLKIELKFPAEVLSAKHKQFDVGIFAQWLNGAPANGLKADVKVVATAAKTTVSGYDAFIFDDPARELRSSSTTVFEGDLSSAGQAVFEYSPYIEDAPGQVRLNFTTRVFEQSGNFSTQYVSKSYIPYEQLVGIGMPKGSGWNDSISREDKTTINFLSVDTDGNRLANSKLEFSVYRIDWRWWWDYSDDNIASYINSRHANSIIDTRLVTDENGKAEWQLDGSRFDWGRYLFRVCDRESRHCSGKVAYLGWSYADSKNPSGDTQLILTTDKPRYQVGDTAYLTIPQVLPKGDNNARFMLSLESGAKILSQRWVNEEIVDNKIAVKITENMAPNIYAHLALIQAYQGKTNDSPVRLYGIAPILVDNPDTTLTPVITTADVVRPESEMSIDVSEQNGKAMTYTLAVVDEGLLGITNYKTPDPRREFYKREALSVLTWDIYELLSHSAARPLHSLITLGGSDLAEQEESKRDKRRFPPVVRFMGPFQLEAGGNRTHQVRLPEYMGAVRVMVVAGDSSEKGQEAYGAAEKTVTVTQPLTLLATLPRVLGPNETFALPVSVFVNNNDIKDVTLSIETNELFEYESDIPALHFDGPGDQIVDLKFKTVNGIGTGTVTVKAQSGNEVASQTVDIPLRSANEPRVVSDAAAVEAGKSKTFSITPNGMLNTNESYLEISRIPDINLEEKLEYLIGYPHGCLEQTTSRLFPQIYLSALTPLTDEQKQDVEYYVREGIAKLQSFQESGGAFNYWPNGFYYNRWANSYAGHFLLEAKRMGYVVPVDMLDKWLKSEQRFANDTGDKKGYESSDAYTLYVLAVAGKPDFNAMNRLKQNLSVQLSGRRSENSNLRLARWLLAAAYARAGVDDAAQALIRQDDNSILSYDWAGYTYGSSLRDAALLMIVYKEVGDDTAAWETALKIARDFNKPSYWYSTQSTAWALNAFSSYFYDKDQAESQKLSYRIDDGPWEKTAIASPFFKQAVKGAAGKPIKLEIKNESKDTFYALLGNRGIPANTEEVADYQNVAIDAYFTDMDGNEIDVSRLKQGTDFKAVVTVSNVNDWARLENLALTMTMPSGWQISNNRLEGRETNEGLEYQDIRDDRVLSYFTLGNYYYYHRYADRTIKVETVLNASFKGRFYLPGWHVKSMYDDNVKANNVGQWVEVVADGD